MASDRTSPSSSADHHLIALSPPSDSSSPQAAAAAAAAAAAPLPPPPPSSSSSRRVPPPCWSVEETLALIDSYQEKWYSLRRGNLRAHHWQEVADAVFLRCPPSSSSSSSSPKTALQCRHKMEKLRKRYRSELSRAKPHHSSSSPWLFFRNMHSMERGAPPHDHHPSSSSSDSPPLPLPSANGGTSDGGVGGGGFGFLGPRPPKGPRSARATANPSLLYAAVAAEEEEEEEEEDEEEEGEEERASGLVEMRRRVENRKKKREMGGGGGMGRVAEALGAMCEGFVRMEQMKMEMASEIHKLRMEMELKRTEMMLDSQRRILDTFLEGMVFAPAPAPAPTKRPKLAHHDA